MNTILTNEERLVVNSEVQKNGKNILIAYILLIFLGVLGIHRFYLNRPGTAIAQLVLTVVGWLTVFIVIGFLPLLVVAVWIFVDLFLVPGMVAEFNNKVELEAIRSLNKTS